MKLLANLNCSGAEMFARLQARRKGVLHQFILHTSTRRVDLAATSSAIRLRVLGMAGAVLIGISKSSNGPKKYLELLPYTQLIVILKLQVIFFRAIYS